MGHFWPMMVKNRVRAVPMRKIMNGVVFYAIWFVCVANGVNGGLLYAPLVLGALALHFTLTEERRLDASTLLLVLLLGACVDTFYLQAGIVQFTTPNPLFTAVVPLWILGIYALFATSLNSSLGWLEGRPWLASLFGFGGGVVSYAYGERMGAVTFLQGYLPTLLIVGVVWAILLPLFYWGIAVMKRATLSQDR